jgi:hypothetical protein
MLLGIDFLAVKPTALFRNRGREGWAVPRSYHIDSARFALPSRPRRELPAVEPLRQQDRSLVKCITRDGADHGLLKIIEPVGCVSFHG